MDTHIYPLSERERKRRELIQAVQAAVKREEPFVGDFHLFRILNILFDIQLHVTSTQVDEDLVFRLGRHGRRVLRLFRRIESAISKFEPSEEERRAIFAELMIWATMQIAHPHLETLKRKERLRSP